MQRRVAITLAAVLSVSEPVAAEDHIVPLTEAQARVAEAAQDRAADLAQLDALLSSTEATLVAERFGLQPDRLRAGHSRLGDADLHELAARARALESDPVAGSDSIPVPTGPMATAVVVVLMVIIAALIVAALWGLTEVAS